MNWKNCSNIALFVTLALTLAIAATKDAYADSEAMDALIRLPDYTTHRESSSNEDLYKNGDARPIEPGDTLILADLEGPGIITHIWCTVGSEDIFYPRSLVVRMYWDGAEEPSVEVPLGDFFGVGHGAFADFESAPVTTSSRGRSRNCFWRMPFKKRARITVTNDSPDLRTGSFYYYLDWQKRDALPEDTIFFHAKYRQEMPAKPGDYTLLETKGSGQYVGTVYSAHQVELGWFGEGDDRFYIDGEEQPSLRGTGTEDYFNDSWGFRAFSAPYHGVSLWEGYFPGDRVTAYRWHIDSPVAFTTSLKTTIEHRGSIFTDDATHLGQFIERPDWISSVAFWYQTPVVAAQSELPPAAERIAPYRQLKVSDLKIRAKPKAMLQKSEYGVTYIPGVDDATLEIDFEIEQPGRYQVNAFMLYGIMSGVYQPYVDDKAVGGPIDFCMTGQDPIWTRFDLHDLDKGTHTLKFEGRGPSPNMRSLAPPFFGLSFDHLTLLRLEDMEGYGAAKAEVLDRRKN